MVWALGKTVVSANDAALTATFNGGTQKSFTANSAAAVDLGSFYAPTAAGTSGQMLVSGGTGAAPTWTAVPTVNNAVLTDTINGVANTFTANAAANKIMPPQLPEQSAMFCNPTEAVSQAGLHPTIFGTETAIVIHPQRKRPCLVCSKPPPLKI